MVRMLLVVTLLASCRAPRPARDPSESSLVAEDPDRQICKPEQVTGTMITRTVCRSAYEADAEKTAAQDWMSRPVNHSSFSNNVSPSGHH